MIGRRFTKYKIFYIWNIFWGAITPLILIVNIKEFKYFFVTLT